MRTTVYWKRVRPSNAGQKGMRITKENHEILRSRLAGEIPAQPKPSRQVESEPCDVEDNDDGDA
jgi:hypothetical protein